MFATTPEKGQWSPYETRTSVLENYQVALLKSQLKALKVSYNLRSVSFQSLSLYNYRDLKHDLSEGADMLERLKTKN